MSSPLLEALYEAREQAEAREDRDRLAGSLHEFVRAAFPIVKPERPFRDNWHIEAICAHLEAVTAGQINRLQVWVPPGTMKSMNVSIFWPVWEWTRQPGLRYWCASHSLDLVWDHCTRSRTLLQSRWFQARWGDLFTLTKAGERGYENDRGGTRSTTTPKSGGLGKHGDRIILDDLLDAGDSESTTRAVLDATNGWYDAVIAGRKETDAAEVLIMQRLHENDPAAHALEVGDWTVLCLPERFEGNHPFAWRGERVHPNVAERLWGSGLEDGDPRGEGDLLWPAHRDEQASAEYAKRLTSFRAAGQLQQRPAAREGEIWKRAWWRFYDPTIRFKGDWQRLPVQFAYTAISVDAPLKDKQTSDNVAVQCWGVRGADRYLLDLRLGKMGYNAAKRTIREMAQWSRGIWRVPQYVLIENAGYGVELLVDLKRELTGVTKMSPGAEGDKVVRAMNASDAIESGNVFLPGIGPPYHDSYNEAATPDDVAAFVANAALFPNVTHDDDIDAASMFLNWARSRTAMPLRTASAMKGIERRRRRGLPTR